MATLNLKSIATFVANQAAAIQAQSTALIDFSVGSVLLAVTEANAAVAMWLQGMILTVLSVSRLATSSGADVDTFVNDFGLYRLSSSASAGLVTFSRATPTNSALIPIGAQVQTADGTQTFTVTLDATNTAYSSAMAGYLLPAGVAAVAVPVVANSPGLASNVLAGAVNRLVTSISGVDYVNNAGPMSGGEAAESDAALKVRFVLYLASLSKGTREAIGYAITSLQLGLQYTITENKTLAGASQPGFFYVCVDDGSGAPPSSLLSNVYAAVDAVRAATIQFAVFPPTVLQANVSLVTTIAPGYNSETVQGQVATALEEYIGNLGLGNGLSFTRLAQVAYDASPGVTDITGIVLNNGSADIPGSATVTIKPGTIGVY